MTGRQWSRTSGSPPRSAQRRGARGAPSTRLELILGSRFSRSGSAWRGRGRARPREGLPRPLLFYSSLPSRSSRCRIPRELTGEPALRSSATADRTNASPCPTPRLRRTAGSGSLSSRSQLRSPRSRSSSSRCAQWDGIEARGDGPRAEHGRSRASRPRAGQGSITAAAASRRSSVGRSGDPLPAGDDRGRTSRPQHDAGDAARHRLRVDDLRGSPRRLRRPAQRDAAVASSRTALPSDRRDLGEHLRPAREPAAAPGRRPRPSPRTSRRIRSLSGNRHRDGSDLPRAGDRGTRLVARPDFSGAGGATTAPTVALIGLHAAHVLAAVTGSRRSLLSGMDPAARHPASVPGDRPLELCRMYWTFVAVLWIALFGLVYLA